MTDEEALKLIDSTAREVGLCRRDTDVSTSYCLYSPYFLAKDHYSSLIKYTKVYTQPVFFTYANAHLRVGWQIDLEIDENLEPVTNFDPEKFRRTALETIKTVQKLEHDINVAAIRSANDKLRELL